MLSPSDPCSKKRRFARHLGSRQPSPPLKCPKPLQAPKLLQPVKHSNPSSSPYLVANRSMTWTWSGGCLQKRTWTGRGVQIEDKGLNWT
ncbi:hypothetical protein QJS10_CPB15g00058 [Acorus calamus]|uniref:Uncharacterized protein n=1 Tax=Acorus calamus TaxID=4465 RepID=A0AAV9D8D7_ACOCL|nr:hypothetical protein QJS10_CPB15g00058 [Acorus calamus]